MLSINPFALPYIAYKDKANLPNSSGIYYVLNRSKREIVYIGRARNIRNRWRNHHRDWDVGILESIHADGRITIAWEIYPENHLKELETKRIWEFKPVINWKNIEDSDLYLYQGDEWQNSPSYCRYIGSNLSKEATATISERELTYWKNKPRLLEAVDYQHSVTCQTIYRYKYLE
jgi:GIY-YIG catalytic domain